MAEDALLLRELTPEDYDAAMALWLGSAGVGRSQDDTREYMTAFLARNPGCSFAAEENGCLVGAIMAGHDGYRGYIHHTAVAEGCRGSRCRPAAHRGCPAGPGRSGHPQGGAGGF